MFFRDIYGVLRIQMTETPLHKAAANNHVEIMKFLLEWQGEEKAELEAKNMVPCLLLLHVLMNNCICRHIMTYYKMQERLRILAQDDISNAYRFCFFYAVWRNSTSSGCEKRIHRSSEASIDVQRFQGSQG